MSSRYIVPFNLQGWCMWIFRNKYLDFLFFMGFGFLSLIAVQFLPENSYGYLILSYIALQFFDSGHVYTTLFRTYFRSSVWTKEPFKYIVLPLVIFAGSFFLTYFPFIYMLYLVTYLAIFHYYRQHIGFLRWYQKLNKRRDVVGEYFFNALIFISFIVFHFRSDVLQIIPLEFRFLNYSDPGVVFFGVLLYVIVFILWIFREIMLAKKVPFELNRCAYIMGISLLYGYCFMGSSNLAEFYIPQGVTHGLAYMAIIVFSKKKLDLYEGKKFNLIISIFLVAMVALLGHHSQDAMDQFTGEDSVGVSFMAQSVWIKIVVAWTYTPVIYHYVIDGFIWKKEDAEAKIIYES